MTTVSKIVADLFPWSTDSEIPGVVRGWFWWSLFATAVLAAAPHSPRWWVQAVYIFIHMVMMLFVYFFLYDAGEWRGRRSAKPLPPPPLLVPWEDAAIVEDNLGCLRVMLLPDADAVTDPARGVERWRGKLPSRELREVDRFTSDIVARRPWESRQ